MKIIAKNLVKVYGDRTVVNDISFEVNKGEVVGLLGPNGAGKTTTFYMVVGLVKANGGSVFLDDRDLTNVPISYLGQAQSGNATTNHIGDYDFMAASVATPANGAVAFDMQHVGCLVQLTLNLQEDITIKNVSYSRNKNK